MAASGEGTGRFARSLGIEKGIAPSPQMLEMAAKHGIETYEGNSENRPFQEGSSDGVFTLSTLCFVANAQQALTECRQVLPPGGRLLLGTIPAERSSGRENIEKTSKGHSVYVLAHSQTVAESVELAGVYDSRLSRPRARFSERRVKNRNHDLRREPSHRPDFLARFSGPW